MCVHGCTADLDAENKATTAIRPGIKPTEFI
jgi:hypothetical protein